MNTLFFGFCVWYKPKEIHLSAGERGGINLHFHEQLVMTQDNTSYYLRVDGKWARDEILYRFPFSLHICSV